MTRDEEIERAMLKRMVIAVETIAVSVEDLKNEMVSVVEAMLPVEDDDD